MNDNKYIFDQIKMVIRTYDGKSLLNSFYGAMVRSDISFETDKHNFWILLNAYKWIIEYGIFTVRLPNGDDGVILTICRLALKMEDNFLDNIEDNRDRNFTFIQLLTNQQLSFQHDLSRYNLARNYIMFKDNSIIEQQFTKLYGLSFDDWMECLASMTLYIQISLEPKNNKHYDGVIDTFFISSVINLKLLQTYLDHNSIDINNIKGARKKISKISKIRNPTYELFKIYRLSKFPYIKVQGGYRILNRKICAYHLKYSIYDNLKKVFKGKFSVPLGLILEKYIEIGLKELNISFEKEVQINYNDKAPDYILADDIIVECKAIELPEMVSVNPTRENIQRYLKKDLIKAISEQMYTFLKNVDNPTNYMCIVVTYKDLNFGSGELSFNRIVQKELAAYIKPSNLFIISVEDWDILLNCSKSQEISIRTILEDVSKANSSPLTYNGSLSGQINSIYKQNVMNLNYLNEYSIDFLLPKMIDRLNLK